MEQSLHYFLIFFAIILLRYFLLAGVAYWLFSCFQNQSSTEQSSDIDLFSKTSIDQDIALSFIATVALAICAASIMVSYNFHATRLYQSTGDYGIWYLIVSFIGVILLQDTCYYFFHRGIHHPVIYGWLHQGHHRSINPTPWTFSALDFPEALSQGLFVVIVVFIIPLHVYVLGLWLITMTIWAIVNHLGCELFPSFSHHWFGKWFISFNHHSLHHRNYRCHYGLYFTFWDWLLSTD